MLDLLILNPPNFSQLESQQLVVKYLSNIQIGQLKILRCGISLSRVVHLGIQIIWFMFPFDIQLDSTTAIKKFISVSGVSVQNIQGN